MSTPSDTPETDAQATYRPDDDGKTAFVGADFARRLETERDTARDALRQVLAEFTQPQTRGQERALDAAKKALEGAR